MRVLQKYSQCNYKMHVQKVCTWREGYVYFNSLLNPRITRASLSPMSPNIVCSQYTSGLVEKGAVYLGSHDDNRENAK